MPDVNQLRRDHEAVIALNPLPADVAFTRKVYVDDPATGTRKPGVPPTLAVVWPAGTVRIFQGRYQDETIRVPGAARLDYERRWAMLAKWDVDVKADPPEPDTFRVTGKGTFRVRQVAPKEMGGLVWGIEADLERVGGA